MKLCLPSGSSRLEEAEMDTYGADPVYAGKSTVIEAGTKHWRSIGHRESVTIIIIIIIIKILCIYF